MHTGQVHNDGGSGNVGAYPKSILDGEKLLSNHTQHLNVNAVELIKTSPSAGLGQASKELAHEAVVQPFTTIEHHTVDSQGFAQILQSYTHRQLLNTIASASF